MPLVVGQIALLTINLYYNRVQFTKNFKLYSAYSAGQEITGLVGSLNARRYRDLPHSGKRVYNSFNTMSNEGKINTVFTVAKVVIHHTSQYNAARLSFYLATFSRNIFFKCSIKYYN